MPEKPIPVAARTKAWVYGLSPAAWMSVSCECCVLSGRGLCDGPITRPEESYRVWSGITRGYFTRYLSTSSVAS
jgi:hypothetical protein